MVCITGTVSSSIERWVATERGLVPTVLTFDPHPTRIFRPDSAPKLIEPLEEA